MTAIRDQWTSKDGRIKLLLGDARKILKTIDASSFDSVVCDPPYAINHKTHGQIFKKAKPIKGDDSLETAMAIRDWSARGNLTCLMFFSPYVPMNGFRSVLCWAKGAHVGIGGDKDTCWKRDFELIGVERNGSLEGKRDSAVISCPAVLPPPSGHFAEKPLPLMEYLVYKLGCKSLIDPCCGSGTTLAAAVRLGVHAIGIELEEVWFEYSIDRVKRELSQPMLPQLDPVKTTQGDLFDD